MSAGEQDRPMRKDVARNRALLLAAAEEVLAVRGRDTSLDEIARHAGLGVGTAYRHFENKAALLQAMYQTRLASILEIAAAAEQIEDPGVALQTFLVRAGELQAADRGLRDAMSSADGSVELEPARRQIDRSTERLVARARDGGRIRSDIAATDIPMVIGALAALTDLAGDVAPMLWRRYLDLILGGMVGDDQPRPPLTVRAPSKAVLGRVMAQRRR